MIKLVKLQVYDHPILGNQLIDFVDSKEEKANKYISLIIGQNGTGKTQIFKVIIETLNAIYELLDNDNQKWNQKYGFKLDMFSDGKIETFNSDGNLIRSSINDRTKAALKFIPNKLLVSAYTFNDKFPKNDKGGFYYYGGLKTTTNNIFLNRPSEDTFKNITKIFLNKKTQNFLNELFIELNLEFKIKVRYRKRRNYEILSHPKILNVVRDIANRENHKVTNEDVEKVRRFLDESLLGKNERARRFKDESIAKIIDSKENIIKLIDFLVNNLSISKQLEINLEDSKIKEKRRIELKLDYVYSWNKETQNKKENAEFIEHGDIFEILGRLDIATFGAFYIFRNDYFDFDDASSGEFHLLHLLSSLLANIESNSVVLIDEPEISLHFNWQNKFFTLLSPITNNFPDCHFIIASHSHFLVSNLHSSSSSIITMRRNEKDNSLVIKNLQGIHAEGWSAEQILFDVFNVASDRNYYMSQLVDEIVAEMSKSKPRAKYISDRQKKLKDCDFSYFKKSDPFLKIVKSLTEV